MSSIILTPPIVYGYGDQQMQDGGYGCTYRNIQTVLGSLGVGSTDMPSVLALMAQAGKTYAPHDVQSMWIEPIQAKRLIAHYTGKTFQTCLYRTSIHEASKRMLRNIPSDYDVQTSDVSAFEAMVRAGLNKGTPVIVDDGIGSYLILGVLDEEYVIGDPHEYTPHKRVKTMQKATFYQKPMWMAMTAALR